jgi:hypothetical protein
MLAMGCTTGQYCYSNMCASCTDTMKDGDETDVDCGGSHCPACAVGKKCTVTADCLAAVCETGSCRVAHSCKELHTAQPMLGDGTYTIDFNGTTAPTSVFCDMTTDNGGWTALINPVSGSLPANVAGLVITTMDISGSQTCMDPPPPTPVQGTNGSWAIRAWGCGNLTFKMSLSWVNSIAAQDVMFEAVLQGDTTHTIVLNGTSLPSDANDMGLNCFSWNGAAMPPVAGVSCFASTVTAPAHVYDGKLSGDLKMDLSAGPAFLGPNNMPNSNYEAGLNIQKLSVR